MTQLGLPRSVKLTRLGRRVLVCAILFVLTRKARQVATSAHDAPVVPAPAATQAPEPPVEGVGAKVENVVAGVACGAPFSHVSSALRIESPDSNATTVIYLLSNPVTCVDLSFAGWDRTVIQGTTVLELKVFGKTPGTYRVGEGPVNARVAAVECSRNAGRRAHRRGALDGGLGQPRYAVSVVLPRLDISRSTSREVHVTGTFDATFCPGGHEP